MFLLVSTFLITTVIENKKGTFYNINQKLFDLNKYHLASLILVESLPV